MTWVPAYSADRGRPELIRLIMRDVAELMPEIIKRPKETIAFNPAVHGKGNEDIVVLGYEIHDLPTTDLTKYVSTKKKSTKQRGLEAFL